MKSYQIGSRASFVVFIGLFSIYPNLIFKLLLQIRHSSDEITDDTCTILRTIFLDFCQDHDQLNYFPIQPPIFTKCPAGDLLPVYYADKEERSTLVTWSPPIANSTHGSVE